MQFELFSLLKIVQSRCMSTAWVRIGCLTNTTLINTVKSCCCLAQVSGLKTAIVVSIISSPLFPMACFTPLQFFTALRKEGCADCTLSERPTSHHSTSVHPSAADGVEVMGQIYTIVDSELGFHLKMMTLNNHSFCLYSQAKESQAVFHISLQRSLTLVCNRS